MDFAVDFAVVLEWVVEHGQGIVPSDGKRTESEKILCKAMKMKEGD